VSGTLGYVLAALARGKFLEIGISLQLRGDAQLPAADHWRKLRSTNPLERLNREIGRRTDVVGIFPDDRSLTRLATSLVIEQNDEWLVGRRYLSLDSLSPLLKGRDEQNDPEEVLELTTA
jgi:hypothetical protein